MTPSRPDLHVVAERLRLIAETLSELEALRGVNAEQLTREPLTRAAAERLLQVVVDLAVDVNAHLAVSLLGRAPDTGRASFLAAGEAGVIDSDLAARLAASAGLRNVLVHRYVDIDLSLVADAIGEVLDGFPEYVRQVASHLQGRSGES